MNRIFFLLFGFFAAACAEPALPPSSTVRDLGGLMADGTTTVDQGVIPSVDAVGLNDAGLGDARLGDTGSPADADLAIDAGPDAEGMLDAMPPPPAPTYPHFETVVDLGRRTTQAWAELIHVDWVSGQPRFTRRGYADSAENADFWPASTIKIYAASAALVILAQEGMTLDAAVTLYHQAGDEWVEDISTTVRRLIFDTFTCSSNLTYTALLRLAGLDWLNQSFFVPELGFDKTALMRGYTLDRPWVYLRDEPQRAVLSQGGRRVVREHTWSGVSYADQVGCTVYNESGTANCSTPRDMAEHMRRVMFHEHLDPSEQLPVNQSDLDWMRYGDADTPVMNNVDACGGPGFAGVSRVFPQARFFHKGGRVTNYRLDLQYVEDDDTGSAYILAVATDTGGDGVVEKLSEEIARMVRTPDAYVHLDYLIDNVNPVTADLVVYSTEETTLSLITKPFAADGMDRDGWTPLPGATVAVPVGESAHTLTSDCLERSGKVHIRGRMPTQTGATAQSDLHYVIVDADQACP